MNHAPSHVIHEVSAILSMPLGTLDLPKLREVFADLFDRVQEGVLAAGLDSDDVILQRFVMLQSADGVERIVAVEWLSDRDRLLTDLLGASPGGNVVLRTAIVRAVTEVVA